MCLIATAWQCSEEFPFVFVGNRDEYHARASTAANWWDDAPDLLGGRDLVAGGSWLGINRQGDFAVVTNRPDLPAPEHNSLSRGALVRERLQPHADKADLDEQLLANSQRYGGFSLLCGPTIPGRNNQLVCHSGGNGVEQLASLAISPGVFGLSNTAVDAPWPKLVWLEDELKQLSHAGLLGDTGRLFDLLLRQDPVPDAASDWVSVRPFIVGDDYGTRCATVIVVDHNDQVTFIEKRFGPGGRPQSESSFNFALVAAEEC